MSVFFILLYKLIPLYILIILGYIAGRAFRIDNKSIANISIYIITPAVVLNGVSNTTISAGLLSLPVLFFILCTVISASFYALGKRTWSDPTKNILAFTAGTGNTGYFGIPVALIIFGNNILGVAVIATLGFTLYESSVGFYITAKGHHSVKDSLLKVLKLPTLYAFVLGIFISAMTLEIPDGIQNVLDKFTGTYTVIGMMIIGLGLSRVQRASLDLRLIGLSFLAKFIIWPLSILLLIWLDNMLLQLFSESIRRVMILMSVVPLAANTVAMAEAFDTHPEKSAIAVIASTMFALFYIPFIVTWILQ